VAGVKANRKAKPEISRQDAKAPSNTKLSRQDIRKIGTNNK